MLCIHNFTDFPKKHLALVYTECPITHDWTIFCFKFYIIETKCLVRLCLELPRDTKYWIIQDRMFYDAAEPCFKRARPTFSVSCNYLADPQFRLLGRRKWRHWWKRGCSRRDGMERVKSSVNWKTLAALEIFGKSLFRRSPSVQKERNRQQVLQRRYVWMCMDACVNGWMDAQHTYDGDDR